MVEVLFSRVAGVLPELDAQDAKKIGRFLNLSGYSGEASSWESKDKRQHVVTQTTCGHELPAGIHGVVSGATKEKASGINRHIVAGA